MNSNDWGDIENVRNQAIAQLAEVCAAMGLSWSASGTEFTIQLPNVVIKRGGAGLVTTLPADTPIHFDVYTPAPTKRKTFDISTWGPDSGIDESQLAMPDDFQMPDYGEILEEGEPPKGDPSEEK